MRRVWKLLALLLTVIFTATFLDQFVLVRLLAERIGLPLLFALIEGIAMVGAGAFVRRFRTETAINFIVGYPIFGAVCFLVGLVRISSPTMLPVVLLFAAAGGYAIYQDRA